ncbi:MAG: ABC transporter substrate-binding protein [Ilumatobacteraceae bacterium]
MNNDHDEIRNPWSRRQFLQRGGMFAAGTTFALSAAGLLTACGSDTQSSAATTATTAAGSTPAGSTIAGTSSGATTGTAAGTAAAGDLATVKFQLGWLKLAQFGGHFVALSKGYFKDEGIDAQFIAGGSGINPLSLVESGQVMMADANGSDILTAVSKNIPLQCFGTIYQSTPNALMSLGTDPLMTLADLKGKTVGLPTGEQQLLTAMLKQAGVDPTTVNMVSVGSDPSVLTSGQIQGYIGYGTQQGLSLQKSGVDVKIVYFDQLGDPDYGNAFFATTDTLKDKADLVTRWLKADLRGWQDYVADPEAAAKLTWDLYNTETQAVLVNEQESAKAAVPLITGGGAAAHGLLWVEEDAFKQVYDLYKAAGTITGDVDLSKVYTQQFLLAAGAKP